MFFVTQTPLFVTPKYCGVLEKKIKSAKLYSNLITLVCGGNLVVKNNSENVATCFYDGRNGDKGSSMLLRFVS
jgi:hypothetical protein